jgi:hypothetical protein
MLNTIMNQVGTQLDNLVYGLNAAFRLVDLIEQEARAIASAFLDLLTPAPLEPCFDAEPVVIETRPVPTLEEIEALKPVIERLDVELPVAVAAAALPEHVNYAADVAPLAAWLVAGAHVQHSKTGAAYKVDRIEGDTVHATTITGKKRKVRVKVANLEAFA